MWITCLTHQQTGQYACAAQYWHNDLIYFTMYPFIMTLYNTGIAFCIPRLSQFNIHAEISQELQQIGNIVIKDEPSDGIIHAS